MSYDLYFWRQTADCRSTPDEVLEGFSRREAVPGLVPIDPDQARRVLRESFPEIEDSGVELTWEGAGSYFQASLDAMDNQEVCIISVSCGFDLLSDEVISNRLTEACGRLGCAMYDPQEDRRYQQPEPH